MAVRRLFRRELDKVPVPTEAETFTPAYYYNALQYRIWVGPNQPPAEYSLNGNIWRNNATNPDTWFMYVEGSGWVSLLAGSNDSATTNEWGLVKGAERRDLVNATNLNVPNTLAKRDSVGGAWFNGVGIENEHEPQSINMASVFSTNTQKNSITFEMAPGSNDRGFIVHETSGTSPDIDRGVLHLIPSDNNVGDDHVAIGWPSSGATNYAARTRLYTDGRIICQSVQTASTIEAKENVVPTTVNALDVINSVNVVDFTYKNDETGERKVGFIAEDTDAILAGPNYDKMDHQNTLGVLIKAVQELSAEVEELKLRLGE